MKSQIKLGTVFGVELGLHYSWLVIALLITFSLVAQFHAVNRDWSEALVWTTAIITGVLFFACLFAHELSHAVVAKAHGIPVHKITLFLLGGVAQIEKEASDPKTEFWMAIVGPITSGVLGLVMFALARLSGWTLWTSPTTPGTALLVWLGYINLALGAFNMIPGFPLDGGRVLRCVTYDEGAGRNVVEFSDAQTAVAREAMDPLGAVRAIGDGLIPPLPRLSTGHHPCNGLV